MFGEVVELYTADSRVAGPRSLQLAAMRALVYLTENRMQVPKPWSALLFWAGLTSDGTLLPLAPKKCGFPKCQVTTVKKN